MSRSTKQHQHLSIPKGILDLELFQPERLRDLDDDALDVALHSIHQFLRPETVNFVIEVALERRGCIEFLLSSLSQDKFNFVSTWVNDIFPHDLDDYSATSLCARLVSTISLSLLFLPYPNEDERPQGLDSSHQYILQSNAVLQALAGVTQSSVSEIEESSARVSQKARKYAQRTRQANKSVDATPFRELHLEVPALRHEAQEIALEILVKQKDTLLTYLNVFRLESLIDTFKRNYIPSSAVEAIVKCPNVTLASFDQSVETPEEIPVAYPQVQPMKAALYFDNAEGFGQWRILISVRADRDLRKTKKKDTNLFRITLKKIKELSNGHFSDDNQKRLVGTNTPIPIYEAKMTRDSRLVYQVDCVQDFDSQVAIRVFGVYTHAELDKRLWEAMGYQLLRKGREYQKRCTFRADPLHKGDKVVPPASFPAAPPPDPNMIPDELPTISDEVLEEVYFLTNILIGILADQDVVHVFQVSPHEQEIIEHTHSCFVQGRSGTGKTTTMLFKMLGIENSWQQNRELRLERPRQLFVTQSRMLADKVEEYFIKLLQSLVLPSQTKSEISDLLERQRNKEEAGLVDQDEALNWREDLPQRFSELQDVHFPMFITFDKLSAMIEADMGHPPGIPTDQGLGTRALSSEYMLERRKSFISFDVFREEYWAHFPQSLTKALDASLVFSEFMGVIKGSEITLNSENHFLDYDTYSNLSSRTQATFASKRHEIYSLFEIYMKKKRDRREYDAADRTHTILRSVAQDDMKGQRIDFLYVDEVQDNLLIDSKLLRAICRNPDGQFWAGDTAQTISVGSSFRFDDLKAFLHRNEEHLKQQSAGMIAPHPPKSYQLVTNFRSHGGIVKCAHSIIVLITKFWPYAIDILPEEKGIVDGIKPVFFSGWDQDNVRYESFLFGTAGHHIEFGAQQCILVRNDAAREKLRKQVGDIGLIMTLYESKGLEFNDVLLYDFFEDSSVDVAQWRVVLNAINDSQRKRHPAPTFDENRHAGVCAELKFLYVAITRARKNLWVVDRSEIAEPIQIYWSSENLVQNCTPDSDVPQLAVSSSSEEWAQMARSLFSHKRYFQAMHSYERAGMAREKAIAYAYHLREQARGIPVRSRPGDSERRNAFTKVSDAFLASAEQATMFRERSEYYRIAAEAFLVLEDHARAAKAFEKASKFTEAAQHYRHAGLFDETVSVIKNHGDSVDSTVADKLTDVARYYYLQRGDLKKASFLFSNAEEQLEFARDCDLDIAEVNILVERGQFFEAADLHIRENRMVDAVEVLLKNKTSKEAMRRASQSLLDALWNVLSFGVLPVELDIETQVNLKRMMQLIKQFDLSSLEQRSQLELQMFSAIYNNDVARLMALGRTDFLRDRNKPATLLCFDHTFRDCNRQADITGTDVQILNKTGALCEYVELVRQMLSLPEPWADRGVQRLFSFTVHSGRVCLPRNTFLHGFVEPSQRSHLSDEDTKVEVRIFFNLYQGSLRRRVMERLEAYCNNSLSVRVFDPCESSAFGRCDRTECRRQHELNHTWFDKRLHFHMYQISILGFVSTGLGQNLRRIWIERLYDVMNPAHPAFGSSTNIALHANRLISRTFDLLKTYWIWPRLRDLDSSRQFLSRFLSLVDLGSFIDSKALADHVTRTPLIQLHRPSLFMRETRGGYVIAELVKFLHGTGYGSIHAGAMFTHHILTKKVPVELTVLCRVLEIVAGSVIMARALNWNGLHGVTLPRSWILENVQKLHRVQNKDVNIRAVREIITPFRDLLERVYSGNGSDVDLLHQNKPLHAVPFRVRNFALARLYVLLCILVGFNTNSFPIRELVVETITSLRKKDPTRMFSSLYSQYINAQEWRQLALTVTSSISPTPLDEMVTLVQENRNAPRTFRGVRVVKFRDIGDIRRQLAIAAGPTSTLNPGATPFIPIQAPPQSNSVELSVEATSDDPEENEDDASEVAAEEEDTEPHEEADVSAIIESIGANFTAPSADALAKQDSAARTLQTHYRRLLTNRAKRIANGLGLPKTRQNQFEAFARAAESMEWPQKSPYRPIFLGALPHLLTCLDHAWSIVMEEKNKVKRQARSSDKHQGIEGLMERQTNLNLEASSSLHRDRDLKQLGVHLVNVSAIIDEIPQAKEELAFDLEMACAWRIYVENRQKPKVEKPVLNTDDLDGMF
ncbi:hypothetical protein DFH94DRAFT_790038 [Russula ochroleuca]|uniref:UvrD-like helicase ATP-binding domain-containing protein n=1 Tax=Russula ochroleuca TaxID=152965 RepID=A0A9P5JSY9_9AGAM|nr:hypothetical protein DFH94DRAFT_790038 [Russula ochroleuca]